MSKSIVLYLCDRKACKNCSLECMYTSDISHAINFAKLNNADNNDEYAEKLEMEKDYWKVINKKGDKNG